MIERIKQWAPMVLLGLLGAEVAGVLLLGAISVVTGEPVRVVIP